MNDPEKTGDWQKPYPDVTRSLHTPSPGVKQSVHLPTYSMESQQEVVQDRRTNETYTLEIANGAEEGKTYKLDKERIVIGRNSDCDIPLPVLAVGRYHAQLVRTTDGYLIEDLKSRSGTYVNGTPVIGRVPLKDKDRIHIGGMILIYHSKPSRQEE